MPLEETLEIQRNYFKEYEHEIAARNLNLMQTVCRVGAAVYAVYFLISCLFFRSSRLSLIYMVIVPVLLLFSWRIHILLREGTQNGIRSRRITRAVYSVLISYAILMNTVPRPDEPSVYFGMTLLMGPVMFIFPGEQQLIMNVCSSLAYCAAVLLFKNPMCYSHDLREGIVALLLSGIVVLLMTQFRVQSDGLKNKYYSLSRHDGLTGLLNKVTGMALAREYVEKGAMNEPFSLAVLDIDTFKRINDSYGHEKGDAILEGVGRALSLLFRKEDVVSRNGGDEFLILLKNISQENAEAKWKALQHALGRLSYEESVTVTCSIGVYAGKCGTVRFEEALRYADETLYRVKSNGRNACLYYEGEH